MGVLTVSFKALDNFSFKEEAEDKTYAEAIIEFCPNCTPSKKESLFMSTQ